MRTYRHAFRLLRTLFLSALLLPAGRAAAGDAPRGRPVVSTIDRVLVYSNQAIVTRTARIKLMNSKDRVTIDGLPKSLIDNSVRVRLEGAGGPRMVNLEVIWNHKTTFKKAEAKQASERLKALNRSAAELRDRIAGLSRQAVFLRSIQIGALPKGAGKSGEPPPLHIDQWEKTLDSVLSGLQKLSEERLAVEKELDDVLSRLAVASAQAQNLLSYETKSSKTVAIEIAGTKSRIVNAQISYRIAGPAWFPQYDVRSDLKTGTVEISMYALVRQRTGEDWSGVELEFSAAEPSRSANLPRLLAWHIGAAGEQQQGKSGGRAQYLRKSSSPRLSSSMSRLGVMANRPDEFFEAQKEIENLQAQVTAGQGNTAIGLAGGDIIWRLVPGRSGRGQEAAAQAAGAGEGQGEGEGEQYAEALEAAQSSILGFRNERTQERLSTLEKLNRQRDREFKKGNYFACQVVNRQLLLNLSQMDKVTRDQYANLERDSWKQLRVSQRLLASQKLASQLVSPVKSSRGYDYKYQAVRREDVPSDGAFSKVVIAKERVKAEFVYEIAPELSKRAFLYAVFVNPLRSPLLAGPAGIFLGNDFVSRGRIATTSAGEPMRVGLGVDEGLAVTRAAHVKRDTAGWRGNWFTYRNEVTVRVRNNKRRAVKVRIMERLPYSSDANLTVETGKIEPMPSFAESSGLRRWDMDVPAGKGVTVSYDYTVTHPGHFTAQPVADPGAGQWK